MKKHSIASTNRVPHNFAETVAAILCNQRYLDSGGILFTNMIYRRLGHVNTCTCRNFNWTGEAQMTDGMPRWWHADSNTDGKVDGANMGPTWGRQDPGGPPDGPINLVLFLCRNKTSYPNSIKRKPNDHGCKPYHCSEIWQACRQQCCWCASQLS